MKHSTVSVSTDNGPVASYDSKLITLCVLHKLELRISSSQVVPEEVADESIFVRERHA